MTPKELSAQIAEIEKAVAKAIAFNERQGRMASDLDLMDAEIGLLMRLLPPGILAAMCRAAIASMVCDDECNTQPESTFTVGGKSDMEMERVLDAFRALLTKEPA